jgi:hypothetical protein
VKYSLPSGPSPQGVCVVRHSVILPLSDFTGSISMPPATSGRLRIAAVMSHAGVACIAVDVITSRLASPRSPAWTG